MDKKRTIAILNSVISDYRREAMIKGLDDAIASLKKSDLEKIDPKTRLPGTMLDKNASNGKLMDFMKKCGPMMKAAKPDIKNPAGIPSKNPLDKQPDFDSFRSSRINSPQGKAVQESFGLDKPPKMGKVEGMAKDDMPHTPGSPEDKAHDIVEEKQPVKDAVSMMSSAPMVRKMFEHLRSKKENGSWERSPANREMGKSEEMSSGAKGAIKEALQQPEDQKQRLGQGNEPKEK